METLWPKKDRLVSFHTKCGEKKIIKTFTTVSLFSLKKKLRERERKKSLSGDQLVGKEKHIYKSVKDIWLTEGVTID